MVEAGYECPPRIFSVGIFVALVAIIQPCGGKRRQSQRMRFFGLKYLSKRLDCSVVMVCTMEQRSFFGYLDDSLKSGS